MTTDIDVIGTRVTADEHVRQESRAGGRYDQARGGRLHHEQLVPSRESTTTHQQGQVRR